MKHILFIIMVFVAFISCDNKFESTILSPDKNVSITVGVDTENDNSIFFSVMFNGDVIIDKSPFELEFTDMDAISKNLEIVSVNEKSINESWERVWGKSKTVENKCVELILELAEKNEPFRKINIIARAYDDGVAFRYQIPEQENISTFSLKAENTTFKFSKDYKVWATKWQRFHLAQEQEFEEIMLSSIKTSDIIGTPLLIEFNKGWGALMEANLTDWAGMFLTAGADSSTSISTLLSPLPGIKNTVVVSQAPRNSPWRLLKLGNKAGDLIESNIMHNLNDPSVIEDVSWITPGRSAWDWWWCGSYAPEAGFKLGSNNETMKYFIDFASEMGWEHQIVDWLWYGEPFKVKYSQANPDVDITKSTDDIDIPYLVEYAKKKGVKLHIWLHWWHLNRQMDEAFKLYEEWGVHGLKIDFLNRNDQEMVNFYHRVLKKAAEHKMVINFHGAYMPTGIDRTYPNFLTREGVLGNEYNKWSTRVTATHCLNLPFTRGLGGQMDFTPGGFLHVPHDKFVAVGGNAPMPKVRGTRCFQLAMPVVYESAMTVFCDSPHNYRNQSGLEFYKVVPTTWDETVVIDGYPGQFIVIARKHGDDWFLGAMTNEQERSVNIDLSFLDNGEYTATIFSDAPDSNENPANLIKDERVVDKNKTLTINMAEAGGCAIHFKK
jgi:alpha-glucosidase